MHSTPVKLCYVSALALAVLHLVLSFVDVSHGSEHRSVVTILPAQEGGDLRAAASSRVLEAGNAPPSEAGAPPSSGDAIALAGINDADGRTVELGGRQWRVSKPQASEADEWPPGQPPEVVTGLLYHTKNSRPGTINYNYTGARRVRPGESAADVAARLTAAKDQAPFVQVFDLASAQPTARLPSEAWVAAIEKGPSLLGAGVLRHPAVALYHSLTPLPDQQQASPYAANWPVTLPQYEDAYCDAIRARPSSGGISFITRRCYTGRKPLAERWLDTTPGVGDRHIVDLRLPPWHRPAGVVRVSNALVISYAHDTEAFFVTAGNATISGEALHVMHALKHEPAIAQELEEAASIGLCRYTTHAGHFPNENLPRLLYLDAVVPTHVPLIYPTPVPGIANSYPAVANWLGIMREVGAFIGRRWIHAGSHNHVLHVKRLYLFTHLGSGEPPDTGEQAPYANFAANNLLAQRLRDWAGRILGRQASGGGGSGGAATSSPTHANHRIVVLRRTTTRAIANHDDVIAAVRQRWPQLPLEAFEPAVTPGYDLRTSLLAIANASIVIAPHGAGNNNIVTLRPGSAFIEVGPGLQEFQPGANNLCRLLGLRYYFLMADKDAGDGRKVRVDPADVMGLLEMAIRGHVNEAR